MSTVDEQIYNVCTNIHDNIENSGDNRSLLSQNILSQLRNLVEAVAVRLFFNDGARQFKYGDIKPAMEWIDNKGTKDIKYLSRFHKRLKESSSHYTVSGEDSERLMLKYYEYLFKTRTILAQKCSISVLDNLEQFPVNLDPSLDEYHEKIVHEIQNMRLLNGSGARNDRFYIRRIKPFFVASHVYYEVTFQNAVDNVSKFERNIAFTDIEITDDYAANLGIIQSSINVLGQDMPILLISDWHVSIRPCEFENFARIFCIQHTFRRTKEYLRLMQYLTETGGNLLDLMDMPDEQYMWICSWLSGGASKQWIVTVLNKAREIIKRKASGTNVLRYLMLHMNNSIIKLQYEYKESGCDLLSNLQLSRGCKPFDTMPLCTSLKGHNPKFYDVARSVGLKGRDEELLAHKVVINAEQHGKIYTPVSELEEFGDIDGLINKYNSKLYRKHRENRELIKDKQHVFQASYEAETAEIVQEIQSYAQSGLEDYNSVFSNWLDTTTNKPDDDGKKRALKSLFAKSHVALIYGAAGTGKSTMVDYIADIFKDEDKLFLAHTNPAKDNLDRRVSSPNSTFRTISSQISKKNNDRDFDLLVIDECSTVCNSELLKVLRGTQFSKLVLVGDVYQIESIEFGNWFSLIRKCVPKEAVFELTTPYRAENAMLKTFWNAVRNYGDNIEEIIAQNGYSKTLNESLFEKANNDEIILCLNYDGLYGINNVNRFLQSSNPNPPFTWGIETYKVNDPILFNEKSRFKPILFNNLKGRIIGIEKNETSIQFDVLVDREISNLEAASKGLIPLGENKVRFAVNQPHSSDDDNDTDDTVVPFQVAYAVSIHKAQGLEYDSVKVVITDANEDNITHNIFYTAITRARKNLQIFWTPETEHLVLSNFSSKIDNADYSLLKARGKL